MALKITLKPNEKLIVSSAVIVNGKNRSEFILENTVPILREKDILSFKDADSPCKRIYFVIQLMYVDNKNMAAHHQSFWELVKDVLEAAPSTRPLLQAISDSILAGEYYQALKTARKLVAYEKEVMDRVRKPA
jgi:flagellar protein FlbT